MLCNLIHDVNILTTKPTKVRYGIFCFYREKRKDDASILYYLKKYIIHWNTDKIIVNSILNKKDDTCLTCPIYDFHYFVK